jgi:hypothetical protein
MHLLEMFKLNLFNVSLEKKGITAYFETSRLDNLFNQIMDFYCNSPKVIEERYELPAYREPFYKPRIEKKKENLYKVSIKMENEWDLPTYDEFRLVLIVKGNEDDAKKIAKRLNKTIYNLLGIKGAIEKLEKEFVGYVLYHYVDDIIYILQGKEEEVSQEIKEEMKQIFRKRKEMEEIIYKNEYIEVKVRLNYLTIYEALKKIGLVEFYPDCYSCSDFEKLIRFMKFYKEYIHPCQGQEEEN